MIPIITEDKDWFERFRIYEHRYFCNKPTDTWHGRTNNPVCKPCSKKHNVSELPNHFKNKLLKK